MGTWGIGSFEDDIAIDWLEDLHDSDPIAFFQQCLDLTGHESLEHLACIGVICTAEMIHGLLRQPRAGIPEDAHEWLRSHRDLPVQSFVGEAITGLNRLVEPDSEMYELWEDDGDRFDAWRNHVCDLRDRLQAVATETA